MVEKLVAAGVTEIQHFADRKDKVYVQNSSDGSYELIAQIDKCVDNLHLRLYFADRRIHHFTPGDMVFIGDELFKFIIHQATPYPLFKTVETHAGYNGNYRYIDLEYRYRSPATNEPIFIPHMGKNGQIAAETSLWLYLKIYRSI